LEKHAASIFSATLDPYVANSEAGACIFPRKVVSIQIRTRSQNTEDYSLDYRRRALLNTVLKLRFQ